jgi:hypothetical protein
MELVLDEPHDDDHVVAAREIAIHMTTQEKSLVDQLGIAIEYFNYPHYKGFTVSLRMRDACC